MNQVTLSDWSAALRSGKYKPGKFSLRLKSKVPGVPDCFCASGVLADLIEPGGWLEEPVGSDDDIVCWKHELDFSTAIIPTYILEEMGISDELVGIVMEKNDQGTEWPVIADLIDHFNLHHQLPS